MTFLGSDEMTHLVVKIEWIERERGWGCRPDGYTLHIDQATAEAFIAQYWKDEEKYWAGQGKPRNYVPDEYTSPGDPKDFEVGDETFAKLQETGSLRVWRFEESKIDTSL
jgi:hypothetical protein